MVEEKTAITAQNPLYERKKTIPLATQELSPYYISQSGDRPELIIYSIENENTYPKS
jgi:hypothetical protein